MGVAVYYVVLGKDPGASDDQIHRAYQRLALEYWSSPDRNTGLAARRFRAIEEAYSVLGDAARRAAYDAQIAARSRRAADTAITLPVPPDTIPTALDSDLIASPPSPTPYGARPRRTLPRPRPSLIITLLLALGGIAMAGGPQRTAIDRSLSVVGRHTGQPISTQPRGFATGIVAAITEPGPAGRSLEHASAIQITGYVRQAGSTSVPPSLSLPRTAPSSAMAGNVARRRSHRAVAVAATRSLHGSPSTRHSRSAASLRDQAPPRAALLVPGDSALPAKPPQPHTGDRARIRVERGGLRHEGREWTAGHWRRSIQQGFERRRPRFAVGHEPGPSSPRRGVRYMTSP